MKSRQEVDPYFHQTMDDLHQGPRIRSLATHDFEIVLRAFISAKPPAYTVNRLDEIEVEVNDKIYNLTKILEHHPDFEHITLAFPTKKQVNEYRETYHLPPLSLAEEISLLFSTQEEIDELAIIANEHFRKMTAYRLQLDKSVPIEIRENMVIYEVSTYASKLNKGGLRLSAKKDRLTCEIGTAAKPISFTIPWAELPADFPQNFSSIVEIEDYLPNIFACQFNPNTGILTEAEARSIRYLTMEDRSNAAYKKINRFLRMHGKIADLMHNDSIDLRTIMFELAYLPRAIEKLREVNNNEMQTVYRGEIFETPRIANDVIHTRTKDRLHSAPGFISTSQNKDISKGFSKGTGSTAVNICITQIKHSSGVDISLYAESRHEKEVLFMPGTQTIYKLNPKIPTELLASPIRSINEIYSHNYDNVIIQWRGEIIKCITKYSKTAISDAGFIRFVDDFCNNIAVYKAGEMIHTLNACRNFIKKIENINPTKNAMRKTHVAIMRMVRNIADHLEPILAHQIRENNVELINAAHYAYEHYYKHPYRDNTLSSWDLRVSIGDIKIERPNHGLTHNLRKSLYLPVICSLLKSHAINEDLSVYLNSLDQLKMTILQIALVFSNTGRESEVGAADNLNVYNSYREKSKHNFLHYTKETGLYHANPGIDIVSLAQNKFIETMGEELRYMGNPDYFKKVSNNYHRDKEKVFIYIMLNLAHRLDLLRCTDIDKYHITMEQMTIELSLYIDNNFIFKAFPVLYKMVCDSIIGTGDRYYVVYENDKLITANHHSYDKHFTAASTNAEDCIKMCFTSNPIFCEVSDGKLKLGLLTKNFVTSPLQQAVLNADLLKIKELISDPHVQIPDFAFLIRFILDVYPRLMDESYAPPENRSILNIHDVNPADAVAALHFALAEKKLQQALNLIEGGVDITLVNDAGETPLYVASKNNLSTLVKTLLKITNNVNVVNKEGISPLSIALYTKSWDAVYELIKAANINPSIEHSNRIFNHAILNNKFRIAATILQAKLPIDLEKTVYIMKDALIFAAKYAISDLIEGLMKRKLKRDVVQVSMDKLLSTSFNLPPKSNSSNFTKTIIALIKNDTANFIDVDAIYNCGYTLLNIAIHTDHTELLHALLQRNVRLNIADVSSQTPIDTAIALGRMHMLQDIIKHCKTQSIDRKMTLMCALMKLESKYTMINKLLMDVFKELYFDMDFDAINVKAPHTEQTLLHYACKFNCIELIELLLLNNAAINALDEDSNTPLVCAAIEGHEDVVRLLMKHGASIKQNIEFIIQKAINVGNIAIICILIETKCLDVNYPVFGKSILTLAVENSRWDIVTKLLEVPGIEVGLNEQGKFFITLLLKEEKYDLVEKILPHSIKYINHYDKYGKTLLHYAAKVGNTKIVAAFIKLGADVNARVKFTSAVYYAKHYGSTPIDIAARYSNWDIVGILLDANKPSGVKPHFNATDIFIAATTGTNFRHDIANDILTFHHIDLVYIFNDSKTQKQCLSISIMRLLSRTIDQHEQSLIEAIFEKCPPPNNIIDLAVELAIEQQNDFMYNFTNVIKYLFKLGFHARDITPLLHSATAANRADLLEVLLENNTAPMKILN